MVIFAALTVKVYPEKFLKNDKPVPDYAFPLFATGTGLILFGMYLCAYIIERASNEIYFQQKEGAPRGNRVFWVQPGGQKVGDQEFDAFIGWKDGTEDGGEFIRSVRDRTDVENHSMITPIARLWIAVIAAILGFVMQFIGLRGLHSAIALALLGGTVLMAILRAGLRAQRISTDKNYAGNYYPNLLKGHELDCVAFMISGCEGAEFITQFQDHSRDDDRATGSQSRGEKCENTGTKSDTTPGFAKTTNEEKGEENKTPTVIETEQTTESHDLKTDLNVRFLPRRRTRDSASLVSFLS